MSIRPVVPCSRNSTVQSMRTDARHIIGLIQHSRYLDSGVVPMTMMLELCGTAFAVQDRGLVPAFGQMNENSW
jgi:hypothetical protein